MDGENTPDWFGGLLGVDETLMFPSLVEAVMRKQSGLALGEDDTPTEPDFRIVEWK